MGLRFCLQNDALFVVSQLIRCWFAAQIKNKKTIVALLFSCSDQEQEEMESGDVHVVRTRLSLQGRRPPRLGGLVHFDDRRRHRLHLQLGQGVDGFVRL